MVYHLVYGLHAFRPSLCECLGQFWSVHIRGCYAEWIRSIRCGSVRSLIGATVASSDSGLSLDLNVCCCLAETRDGSGVFLNNEKVLLMVRSTHLKPFLWGILSNSIERRSVSSNCIELHQIFWSQLDFRQFSINFHRIQSILVELPANIENSVKSFLWQFFSGMAKPMGKWKCYAAIWFKSYLYCLFHRISLHYNLI